jgi:hypothetical protein
MFLAGGNKKEGKIRRGARRRRRRSSIFGQGYRYALRDQDAFCLTVRQPAVKNYRGRKYVQWNGGLQVWSKRCAARLVCGQQRR